MKITINGQDARSVIAKEVLDRIQASNPDIHPDEYKNLEEVPGFLDIIKQPHYVAFDQSDHKTYIETRQRMARSERFHKGYTIDLRRDSDGHQSVVALYKGELLWEMAIGWNIVFDTKK